MSPVSHMKHFFHFQLKKFENANKILRKCLFQILLLRSRLLVDDSDSVWEFLSEKVSDRKIIDIILDNAGFELFADLCLAGTIFINIQ